MQIKLQFALLSEPPRFVKRPRGFYQAMETEMVEMPCEARGERGVLETEWFKEGRNFRISQVWVE